MKTMTISKKRITFVNRLINAMYYSNNRNASYYMTALAHDALAGTEAAKLVAITDQLREISVSHEWIANMAREILAEESE